MQAGVYAGPGRMAVESRPIPRPGAGEVLVRVRACGICGSDLSALHAQPPFLPHGLILGHEASGIVQAVGKDVSGYSGGERVVIEPLLSCGTCSYCASGRDSICRSLEILGVHTDGAFAEYVVAPARRLYRIPDEMDYRLASLTEPAAIAVHGLRVGGFRPGARILVLGAGMIGLATVAAARAWGAGEILLTARYPHQAELGRALGATQVLSEQESTREALDRLGIERPIEMVVETVGGHADTLTLAGAAIAPGGTAAILGLWFEPAPIDALTLIHKEARLQFANCYYTRESGKSDFEEAMRLIAKNPSLWSAMSTHFVPLDQINQGFELASAKKTGAVKVTVMVE